jgi:hypothetical protein
MLFYSRLYVKLAQNIKETKTIVRPFTREFDQAKHVRAHCHHIDSFRLLLPLESGNRLNPESVAR